MSEPLHAHSPTQQELEPRRLERAATWLSLACAVHCLVFPLIGGLLPALSASHVVTAGSGVDTLLTFAVVGSVAASGALGFSRHRDLRVLAGMGVGLALYLFGHVYEGSNLGLGFSIAGALVLAGASYLSARLTQAAHDHDHAQPGHQH
ncbi:MAG: MerC domain-containing protein [Myxococcales bacterium]